ncbi:MAG: glycosyltransferase [Lachnospiraceae bacterium]|nr:glycosyltransferase [Lachnospiraceae bacterium]
MKISIFTYSVTRSAGGVLDAVRDLFLSKMMEGQELTVFSYQEEDNAEDIKTWKHLPLRLFKAGPFFMSREAKNALLSSEADILHMEGLWRWPHLWMSEWKKQCKKPIVCTPHGMLDPYIIKSQGKLKRAIANLFFQKGLDSVTCYHALCQKELEDIRAYGLKQPIAIIPNGIYLPESNAVYKRSDSKRHLLYLGRLHKKKGVDMLLEAVALIKQESPELLASWHIDLVGWDHENCQSQLEEIVNTNSLHDVVTFHGGLFGEDKVRMYATSDAYILPSHGEGLPMTVLEAWSWRLPVVMTPHCNIPEGFEANAAIRIQDDVSSVKEGLVTLLNMSDEERQNVGNRGYELVKSDFTWDASAAKMIKLYEWLVNRGEKPNFVYE